MFIGVYSFSVLFSYIGLLLSIVASIFALNNNFKISLLFFLFVGLIDMFDGKVASLFKRTNFEKTFGVQIDTVLDTFNFTFTPIVLLYSFQQNNIYNVIFYFIYIFCATMRLAYFNSIVETTNSSQIYYGVPTTTITIYLPLMFILSNVFSKYTNIILNIMLLIISIAYIMNIKIIKPSTKKFYIALIFLGLLLLLGIMFIL